MLRRYLWKLCGTHNIGRINTRQEVSITAKERRNKNKCVWIPLKLKPEQNVSLSSCSIFCLCAWWEGWRKKTNDPKLFFFPSPNNRLRAGTDNLTAQIEHNFLTDEAERWRLPPPVHGRQPNTFPATLCCCPAPAWAKSLTLLAGNRVSAASVVAAGCWLNDRKKMARVAEGGAPATSKQDFYTSEPRSRNDLAPQVQRFIYSWGLFYTPIVARAHWNWVESNILPYSLNDASQTDFLRTAKSPAGGRKWGLCTHRLKMHQYKYITMAAAVYRHVVASCSYRN